MVFKIIKYPRHLIGEKKGISGIKLKTMPFFAIFATVGSDW